MKHPAQDRKPGRGGWLQAAGDTVRDLQMYARFALALPGYLRHRPTVEEGRRLLRQRLAQREQNFLTLVERAVYGYPGSPYLPLLREAGCEAGDLAKMLRQDGLESTLTSLREAGVQIRFEEFKGRATARRGGREIGLRPDDFNNPFLKRHFETRTSGSTGAGTRNPNDLDHRAARKPISLAMRAAQGVHGLPTARITGRLPYGSGPPGVLSAHGGVPERWFVPVLRPRRPTELRYRLAHHYMTAVARLHGVPVPRPEPLELDDVLVVARWAADTLRDRGPCVVHCTPSMALRICLAAREAQVDLAGVTFTVNGEPMTDAKLAGIHAVGARALANYSMSEVGRVGTACARPATANDQHLAKDHLGVIQAPRTVGGARVDALLLTTLLPTTPRVLINVEIDDYGVIEERACGCPLHELGLTSHVRDVRSFGKLTAEGMTLIGSEMVHLLEAVLPERFGGSALDYQLLEEEDEQGFTRICLRVSPTVELDDETALLDTVRGGLEKASLSAELAGRLWTQAGALRIRREPPVVSGRGKLLPLRLRGARSATDRAVTA